MISRPLYRDRVKKALISYINLNNNYFNVWQTYPKQTRLSSTNYFISLTNIKIETRIMTILFTVHWIIKIVKVICLQ